MPLKDSENKQRIQNQTTSDSSLNLKLFAKSPLQQSELGGRVSGKTSFLFFFLNYITLNLILFSVDNVLIFQQDPSVPQQGVHFCNTCT